MEINNNIPNEYRVLSPWAYFGYSILFAIPLIGFICAIVFACDSSNLNRRNFARSYFCGLLIAVILIGTITFVLIKGINERNSEPLIGIDGVNFTLNNIKDNFLNSEYAQNNDCTGSVSEDTILITCNSNKYNFTFNKFELELDSSYEESKEVFK